MLARGRRGVPDRTDALSALHDARTREVQLMSTSRLSSLAATLALVVTLVATIPGQTAAQAATRGGSVASAALPASYRLFLDEVGGSHFVSVRGSRLHYVEMGDAARPTLLLVHGSPDNAYTWRNIMPILATRYHVVAVDLLGFGRSGQPAVRYGWKIEISYLSVFISTLNLRHVTLVATDIGALFSFAYAQQHPGNVAGIAFWETFVQPIPSYASLAYCGACAAFFPRDPAPNLAYARKDPQFIAQAYSQSLLSPPTPDVLAAYAFPFTTPTAREIPIKVGSDMPIGGRPAATYPIIASYARYLRTTTTPKLALYGTPGYVLPRSVLARWSPGVPNLTLASAGRGYHYLSEDQPGPIAQAILAWRATF